MSRPERQESAMPPLAPRRHPAAIALMVVSGVVLLFPGLCTLFVIFGIFGDDLAGAFSSGFVSLWVVCLAISAGGILLIAYAFRRKRG